MNGLPYYKAYPRDFIEGTIGMPFEVKAAYRLILDAIYMQGGNLPDDSRYISGLLGCSVRKWNALREALIEAGKLRVSGDYLKNYRVDKELETLRTLQDKQRENRSRPNKNKDLPSPPSDHTEPDTDKKKEPKGSSQKGSRLAANWALPLAWGEWALGEGVDELTIRREADKFCDYWHGVSGAKGVKADWFATWRNWIRKAMEDRPRGFRANQPQHGDIREINGRREVYQGPVDGWLRLHG